MAEKKGLVDAVATANALFMFLQQGVSAIISQGFHVGTNKLTPSPNAITDFQKSLEVKTCRHGHYNGKPRFRRLRCAGFTNLCIYDYGIFLLFVSTLKIVWPFLFNNVYFT